MWYPYVMGTIFTIIFAGLALLLILTFCLYILVQIFAAISLCHALWLGITSKAGQNP
jgi:hypothetical protein